MHKTREGSIPQGINQEYGGCIEKEMALIGEEIKANPNSLHLHRETNKTYDRSVTGNQSYSVLLGRKEVVRKNIVAKHHKTLEIESTPIRSITVWSIVHWLYRPTAY